VAGQVAASVVDSPKFINVLINSSVLMRWLSDW